MLPEPLRQYLASKGLQGSDVPKIVGIWVGCKYTTKGALVLLGMRYQPLSRLFRRAYMPIRERARVRLATELARTENLNTRYARGLRRASARMDRRPAWVQRRRDSLRSWSWFRRFGDWYREQAAKKSEWVAKNQAFSWVSRRLLASDPAKLAIGTAEGLILGVALAPIYYPLYFFLAVRYYQTVNSHQSAMWDLAEVAQWRRQLGSVEVEDSYSSGSDGEGDLLLSRTVAAVGPFG